MQSAPLVGWIMHWLILCVRGETPNQPAELLVLYCRWLE